MALTDKNKLDIAFKKLSGKAHSAPILQIGNENVGSFVQLNSSTIFGDEIPLDPSSLLMWEVDTNKVIQKVTFVVEPITETEYLPATTGLSIQKEAEVSFGSTIHAYKLKLSSSYQSQTIAQNGSSPFDNFATAPFIDNSIVATTSGKLQLVSPSFNFRYEAKVYSGNTEILWSAPDDMYLDYYSGILFVQDANPTRYPTKVEAYIYVGKYSDKKTLAAGDNLVVQNQVVYLTSSITGGLDDVKINNFLSASQITASSALFDNLTVQGTLTTIDTQNLTVKDQLIEMNTGAGTSNQGAGLYISGSGGDIFLTVINNGSGMELNTYFSSSGQQTTYLSASNIEVTNNISASSLTASYFNGNGENLTNLTIGNAEAGDNVYTDGLFTDFTPSTYVGTAIDRINEVLKGLAPSKAPDLTNVEYVFGAPSANLSTTLRLGFGTGKGVANYINVTKSLGPSQLPVAFNAAYSPVNGLSGGPLPTSSRRLRLGVLHTPVPLTMSLNANISEDKDTFVNYKNNAFNVVANGVGNYILAANDLVVEPYNISTTDTNAASNNNFKLTEAFTGSFKSSGLSFDLFRHRTGSIGIGTEVWQPGHNYVLVLLQQGSTAYTNYVDWIYDPSAKSGISDDYIIENPVIASSNFTGDRYISGVHYYTGGTYNVQANIKNLYKYTYPDNSNGGITFGSLNGVTPTAITDAVTTVYPTTASDNYSLTSSHTITTSNFRRLNESVSSTINISNGIGKSISLAIPTSTMLLDNVIDVSTDYSEKFISEARRGISGDYSTQTQAVSALNTFPSSSKIDQGGLELAVYYGTVRYPTKILNNGNVEDSLTTHKYGNQPNYSSLTGNRSYFRIFKNSDGNGTFSNIYLTIKSTDTVPVDNTAALTGNSVKISVKIPGRTGWRDAVAPAIQIAENATPLADNLGLTEGTVTSTNILYTTKLQFYSAVGPNTDEYFVVRVEAPASWAGSINEITFSRTP